MNESIPCIHCKAPINPLRIKALPGTKTCVDCSTTGAKRGVTTMFGSKDHTWTDVVFMEPDQYEKYEKINKKHIDIVNPKLSEEEE
jgi:hypothetical protein